MGTALAPSNPSPGGRTPLWSVLHTRLVSKIPSDEKALQPKAVIPSSRQIRPKDGNLGVIWKRGQKGDPAVAEKDAGGLLRRKDGGGVTQEVPLLGAS